MSDNGTGEMTTMDAWQMVKNLTVNVSLPLNQHVKLARAMEMLRPVVGVRAKARNQKAKEKADVDS